MTLRRTALAFPLAAIDFPSVHAQTAPVELSPAYTVPSTGIGGYATLSLGAGYSTRIAGKPTTFQAVLDNATDRNYWSTAGNGYIGVGAPRTLKLLARVSF